MCLNLCFPRGDEKDFILTARRLSLSCLWFVYDDLKKIKRIKDEKIKINYGILGDKVSALCGEVDFVLCDLLKSLDKKGEKIICFVDSNYLENLTQVKIKAVADTNKKVVVPLNLVLKTNISPKLIEKTIFLIRLFKKYKVAFFVANFAKSTYELKSEKEILALCDFLGIKKKR